MSFVEEVITKYNELPHEIRKNFNNDSFLAFLSGLEERFKIDLKFLLILILVGEINIEDVVSYLRKKFSLNIEDASEIKNILFAKISDSIIGDIIMEKSFLDYEEKIKIIFRRGLVDVITGITDDIEEFNARLTFLFSYDSKLSHEDLIQIMYKNNEALTNEAIILGEHKYKPSIENWLKDFIKTMGTGMFSNVQLSNYFNQSKNAKKLKSKERRRVTKMLQIYRGLKFYPESMESMESSSSGIMEFIVVDDIEGGVDKKNFGPPTTEDERTIEELEKELKTYREGSLEYEVMQEEVDRKKHLEELHFMLNKFKEGSLERMAVEEEIKRFEV